LKNEQTQEDVKKKALNLKIKATKSSNFKDGVQHFWESAEEDRQVKSIGNKEIKEDLE